ncbi:hypothetical protein [Pseudonocardia alni]|jgi:hypothetical protein|uniref:TrbL/VirB6 plasmid conjugal transfer protein n=2 Tax=Pseudonocardia alni TaxID=33907 RepID=A0AA44UUZ4_PSEA5|nr:hypothetical protein [Pseudonocardia alni]NWJ75106.1 hypothetical protein [Pseudonocardia pini]PKB41290.1 hypothetical protein ATL51_0252 [Pseudonocardia alni]
MTALLLPLQPAPPPDGGGGPSGPSLGDYISNPIGSAAQSAFDTAMQNVWNAGIWLLKAGFTLADQVSTVELDSVTGQSQGASSLWSSLMGVAGMIALGLFFFQLISVALRGGRGMFRAFTGPLQFGLAIALTTGVVVALLQTSDGLTEFFLSRLDGATSFDQALANDTVAARIGENPDLGEVEDSARSMILGLAALFGIIPAGIGFALQMIFRQAAILVLVATIPMLAAMLVADSTAPSFWRGVRWLLAAILMKPALALVLLIGVSVMARAEGVAGLLAGTAVLLVSLFCPMVLFRLLAFVDPGTGAGMALRSGGSRGSSAPGADGGTSESINVARMARSGSGGGGPSAGGGGELGGSTAASPTAGSTAAAGRAGGAGAGAAGGGAGGGAAAGGAAAGLGAVGGVAAAAVVGGYMATKAAGQAAGGYASSQMAQTGVGHPGPAPAAGGGDVSSAAGDAYAGATATSGWSGQPAGGDNGPIEPGGAPAGGSEPEPAPPSVDAGPPEAGRPDSGPSTPPRPHEAPPVNTGSDGPSTTPEPTDTSTTAWAPAPPRPAPDRAAPDREDRDR